MNIKILALIASLIVSSCAGIFANNAAVPQTPETPASTTVSVTAPSASQKDTTSAEELQAEVPTKVQAVQISVQKSSSCPNSTASSKAATASSAPATCAQKTTCAQNCTGSAKTCAQNLCAPNAGTTCTAGSSCGTASGKTTTVTYQSLNDYINSILSKYGKTCPKTTTPSSGSSSSKPASSAPSSGTSSTPASSKPASSTPSTGTASGTYASFQNQVFQIVNQERTSRGLKALTMDSALNNTATLKSQDMAKLNYFDHTSPTYGSPFDLMQKYGISFRTAGENIAMGQTSPQQVMTGWMNSEGHRANILNSSFTKIGVGIAQNSSGRYYWTQHFTG